MADGKYPYARGLARFLGPAKPRRRRGAPLKLAKEQQCYELLRTIAKINKNKKHSSDLALAKKLHGLPQYSLLSERQLRRDVGVAISVAMQIVELDYVRAGFWPPAKSVKLLREKTLELLRQQYRRHNN